MNKTVRFKNFAARMKEARASLRFAQVLDQPAGSKAGAVVVPGHDGRRYEVLVRRLGGNKITVECRLMQGQWGHEDCPSRYGGHVCYHGVAAVLAMAEESGIKIKLRAAERNASLRATIDGGTLFELYSHDRGDEHPIYAVALPLAE